MISLCCIMLLQGFCICSCITLFNLNPPKKDKLFLRERKKKKQDNNAKNDLVYLLVRRVFFMLTGPTALTDKTAPTTVALATLIALEIRKKSFSFPIYPYFPVSH